MNISSKRAIIKRIGALYLAIQLLLTGIPLDPLLSWAENATHDHNVVDALYWATKDRNVADSLISTNFPRVLNSARAAVTPSGVVGFGETASNDIMQFLSYTSPSTYTDRGDSIDTTTNTNDIFHVEMKTAPTRDEIMAGQIEHSAGGSGTLHITRCVGGCDAAADWSEELEITGVTASQTCDGTVGACIQAFGIAYEQLSGDAIVFYGKSANDGIIYYNIWNGTSWAGESSYTFSSGSSTDTNWVRVVSEGDGLIGRRSDRILFVVSDAGNSVFAAVWSGSSFGNLTTIDSAAAASTRRHFDGAWESLSGNAVVVYGNASTNSTTPFNYKTFTTATSTWDATDQGSLGTFGTTSTGAWATLRSDPGSNRIAAAIQSAASSSYGSIWKSDGSTAGWTTSGEVTGLETSLAPNIVVTWEHGNSGTPMAMFLATKAGTVDATDYATWTQTGGFSLVTLPGAMADDAATWKIYASPNNDEIFAIGIEWSDDMCFQVWSGSAWDADCTTTEYSTTLPPNTATAHNEQNAFDFTYRIYSSWSRNWRFFNDETSNTPTSGINSENTTATGIAAEEFIRLRVQLRELGSVIGQTDTRKKLQYTSGCNPNTTIESDCTWSDVGDVTETSATWRYASQANGDSVCTNCNDNTAIASQVLTGSTQSGSHISDKNAAAGTNMDHTAGAIVEYDYALKAEATSASTTYYFRVVDVVTDTPIQVNYRRQDTGTTDCLSTTCTYPSVTTAGNYTLTQNDFEIWNDNDSLTPTDAWGNPDIAENTAVTALPSTNDPIDISDEVRVRMNLTVGGGTMTSGSVQLKMQYAAATDCTTVSSWSEMGVSSDWNYATSSVTDGTDLTTLLVSTSDVAGNYIKSASAGTNPNAVTAGQDMEVDFHISFLGATVGTPTSYCFRATLSDGTALDAYNSDSYPRLEVRPLSNQLMRHGNFFGDDVKKGFLW